MKVIGLLILATIAFSSIGHAQNLNCESDMRPQDARSNLNLVADAPFREDQRDCIKRSIETLGSFTDPGDIPLLVKFLEFKIEIINTDPPGITLRPRFSGDEYPATWVLARQGPAANPVLIGEIVRTDTSPIRRRNAFLAFLQANGDTPENAIQLLKEKRAGLSPAQQSFVDQAVQDILASPMCARSKGRCDAPASKP